MCNEEVLFTCTIWGATGLEGCLNQFRFFTKGSYSISSALKLDNKKGRVIIENKNWVYILIIIITIIIIIIIISLLPFH